MAYFRKHFCYHSSELYVLKQFGAVFNNNCNGVDGVFDDLKILEIEVLVISKAFSK